MAEWYRHKTWAKADQDFFFQKLGRARKDGRAQYLRIQALELMYTKQAENVLAAEILLHKILSDFPEDMDEKALVLEYLGEIAQLKGEVDNALSLYLQAITLKDGRPELSIEACLAYAELIVKNKKLDGYAFVEELISSQMGEMPFPIHFYRAYSIMSITSSYRKDREKAIQYSELAEKNANAKVSRFTRHKNLGLVTERDTYLDQLVPEGIK